MNKKNEAKYRRLMKTLADCVGLTVKELEKLHMHELNDLWKYVGLPRTEICMRRADGLIDDTPLYVLGK